MQEDLSTLTGVIASIGGLIASFISMKNEQRKHNLLQESIEQRIEYKLRIYEILTDSILSFDEIVSKFNATSPTKLVDQIELRKCLYEMLVEDNIVSFDDGTYTANTASSSD